MSRYDGPPRRRPYYVNRGHARRTVRARDAEVGDGDESEGSDGGYKGGIKKIKVLDKKGRVQTETLADTGKVVPCCCCTRPPPGGWKGPFGFFRLMSFAFVLLALFAIAMLVLMIINTDWLGIIAAVLLFLAAAFCAVSAFAHEGLEREVAEMAKQNDRYATKNELLREQVKELGVVADRLQHIQNHMGVNIAQLHETLNSLHQLTATAQLSSILSAFTQADSFGDKNKILEGPEVNDFLVSTDAVLRQAAPTFNFSMFRKEALKKGLDLFAIRLLINAVVASSDVNAGKSEAQLWLVMFGLNPEKNIGPATDAVYAVLKDKGYSKASVKAKLLATQDRQRRSNFVEFSDLMDIASEVMLADQSYNSSRTKSDNPIADIAPLSELSAKIRWAL